jgi:hypothetical protein
MRRKIMRIQAPEDFTEDNVTVTANILFVHFANDLAGFINTFMTEKHGVAWLQDLRVSDNEYKNFNPKDPAALLKDLARNGGSKLRPALNSKIERGFLKSYYEDLDDLLGERNAWLHRQVQETKSELLDLIATLLRVGKPLDLKIVEDCMTLRDLILNPTPVAVVELAIPTTEVTPQEQEVKSPEGKIEVIQEEPIKIEQADIPEKLQTSEKVLLLDGEKRQIGEIVNERLLSHSYVLHLNGEIRDRASEELLSSANPMAAQKLGPLLIARKPNGGRVRITEDGILCAFFGEKWGYLAQVKPEDWFPSHLSDLSEEQ